MKYRGLGKTGLKVSALSYGASSLGSVFRKINEEDGIAAVHEAIDLGMNLIDVSPYYGLTTAETVLGKALRNIPRDRYLLATKAGRYGDHEFDFSAERIVKGFEESLARLGCDYVDILNLHDIDYGDMDQIIHESLPALLKLKEEGKVRHIGVTCYHLEALKKAALQGTLDTIITFGHYTLNDTSLLNSLSFFQSRGIGVINASPVSLGLLTRRGAPDWHPVSAESAGVFREAATFCDRHGVDIAKLAVQFTVANEDIPTTLVGTASRDNLRKNVAWIDEPIDWNMIEEVRSILKPVMQDVWKIGKPEYYEGALRP